MLGYSFTVKTEALFAYARNKTIILSDRNFISLVTLFVVFVLLNSVTPLLLLLLLLLLSSSSSSSSLLLLLLLLMLLLSERSNVAFKNK